jgi:PIN domain nuclease of toxin-antitoxin system
MKLLLDTHMLLWAAAGTLPEKAEKMVVNGENTLYFSPASIWEVGIKKSLGRSGFKAEPEVLRQSDD